MLEIWQEVAGMQSGDVKLKPCRNCGGIARLYYSTGTDYWEDTFSYYCEKCGAETKEFAFEEQAAEAWNNGEVQIP